MATTPGVQREKLHFLHIGKTGGTALAHVFKEHTLTNKYEIVVYFHHHITLRDVPEGEKVLFFLRDPIARFVSGFYSRQRRGRPLNNYEWDAKERVAFETFTTVNQLGAALADKSSDTHARAEQALKDIYHVRSSYYDWFESDEYFLSRLPDILFIGFQESLDRDFATLKQLLAFPENAQLPTDDIQAHRNPAGLDKTLRPEASAALEAWYARDYHFYNLCKRIVTKKQHG